MSEPLTYKDSGVDQTRKDAVIDRVLGMMKRTYGPRVIDNPWGFAGLFSLSGESPIFRRNYRRPVLIGCADGVGTKLRVASELGKHDTVGIDLVAMNVNDLIVTGGEPLFFLDYIALGRVQEEVILDLVKGIVTGCEQAGCALLGGETAEMPGFYKDGDYELAGFAVGVVERHRLLDGKTVAPGDVVLGVASSGLHSNGYSLVRKLVAERKFKLGAQVAELGCTLGEELLRPTRIYVKAMRELTRSHHVRRMVKALAHITGGGLIENVPRVLPENVNVEIKLGSWEMPPVFPWLEREGNLDATEMRRVFNLGIGMVLILDPYFVDVALRRLAAAGERAFVIGEVRPGAREVVFRT
ncbi:MAG: phosphoribosylformylglycinamidine cyclo-ligase [Planctomycetes bacterium]|nr:phosphoribosylformylglycinamidine cyclo-ligase [Planctomycetota bacterium]